MKLLLDQCVPYSCAGLLRDLGYDTVHTVDLDLQRAPDLQVLMTAAEQGRIVLTFDRDFPSLSTLLALHEPSIVHWRAPMLPAPLCQALHGVLRTHAAAIEQGALLSVTARGVRLRELPISPR